MKSPQVTPRHFTLGLLAIATLLCGRVLAEPPVAAPSAMPAMPGGGTVPAPPVSPAPGILTSTPAVPLTPGPSASPSVSEEVSAPVEIHAGSLVYTPDRTVASGGVEIHVDEAVIKADHLTLDNKTMEIQASGNVNLTRGTSSVSADTLSYNVHTHRALMQNVVGRGSDFGFNSRPVNGELFFWAQSIEWDSKQLVLTKGTITTCDLPPIAQHYHITADKVTVIPDDEIYVTKARLFVHSSEVLGVPKAQFSLKKGGQARRQSLFPQFGYNSVDGVSVKETIPFGGNDNFYGTIHVDYYQRTGLAGGITDYYKLGDQGQGYLYYYSLHSPIAGADRYQLTSRINYKFDNGIGFAWNLDTSEFGTPGVVAPVNFNSVLVLNKNGPHSQLNLSATTASLQLGQFTNVNTGYNFLYRTELTSTLSNLLNVDYTTQATAQLSSFRLHFLDHMSDIGPLFDTNLDYEFTSGTSSFFVNREPELTLRSHRLDLVGVPLDVSVGVGEFDEQPTNVRLSRADLQLQIPDMEFRPWDRGTLYFQGGYRQLAYQGGDEQYVLGFRSGLIQDIGDHVTTRLDLASQTPNGFSPFQTDFFDTYQNLVGGIEFSNKDYWRASLLSGYDVHRGVFQSLLGRLNVNVNQDLGGTLAASFDPNQGALQNVEGELRLQLSPSLYLHTYDLYDFVNRRLTYNDFALTHETHDFVTMLVYRGVQNELYMQFAIKGFPFNSPTIGPNPGGILQGVAGASAVVPGGMTPPVNNDASAPYGL